MANQRVAHVRQHRSSLMLFLRTLLIFVLGIFVVAAIPVSPMTSSIYRRDPGLRAAVLNKLGREPFLDVPADENEAKNRLDGLWTVVKKLPPPASEDSPPSDRVPNLRSYRNCIVHAKIARGELVILWPRWHPPNTILDSPTIGV